LNEAQRHRQYASASSFGLKIFSAKSSQQASTNQKVVQHCRQSAFSGSFVEEISAPNDVFHTKSISTQFG